MLAPVLVRNLLLDPGVHPRGQPHLSAASGLVLAGRRLYTVADDEHHLGLIDVDGISPVHLYRILPGDLPQDKAQRKKAKPDLEALAFWPPAPDWPHGALFAIGSGSRPNRQQAFLIALDSDGMPRDDTRALDLAALYAPLRERFADLNIEGAFIDGDRLRLLQRANKGDARNACVDYPVEQMQEWLAGRKTSPPAPVAITEFSLGAMAGAPLGFTDGAAVPGGGWIFSAVAEDTSDSYNDGACAGSALGWVGADGRLLGIEALDRAPKVEGIALAAPGQLLMVTDSDDPGTASALLSLALD